MTVALVWAQARRRVIGRDGRLPWRLPEDLAHFRKLTQGATVLMGRATWESLPEPFRPLPGRRNLVLTTQADYSAPGAEVHDTAQSALRASRGPVWVIGGAKVYQAALPGAARVAVTEVDLDVQGDRFAPELGPDWRLTRSDPQHGWHTSTSGVRYRFRDYSLAVLPPLAELGPEGCP
jgi:dihydrofolate reductase